MYKNILKDFLFFFQFFHIIQASFLLSGLKTFNNFLYLSRYKEFNIQNKTNTCSLSKGPNCFFTEKQYISTYKEMNKEEKIFFEDWNKSFKLSEKYGLNNSYYFYRNKTLEYLLKNKQEIDKEQNSKGEVFKYLLTFDFFDESTKKKDIYFEESEKKIFYNQEIIIDIKGKLRLSYDKDESEAYLKAINVDYPSNTYGIIESKYISISFKGKLFICDFVYIKPHNERAKKESIYFVGYIGNKVVFTQSFSDNKKRNEKWLKVHFQTSTPINNLIISGSYDIDNIAFTFPNKNYDFSNLYDIYGHTNKANLIKDEDI